MTRNLIAAVIVAIAVSPTMASAGEKPAAMIYKTPNCGCCEQYADHMRQNGFDVTVKPTRHREWQDTVLMGPRERAEIAFVADNPGDWMFHCHILEHQAGGMMGVIRVG